jgi:hypothetical protein
MASECIIMRGLVRSMRESGRMICGMAKVPIVLAFPQRSSSRETGKEGCSTARLRLFTKTKIDLSGFLKTEGKMEEAKLFMEMDHILKENSKMISQQVEEKCPIELREE